MQRKFVWFKETEIQKKVDTVRDLIMSEPYYLMVQFVLHLIVLCKTRKQYHTLKMSYKQVNKPFKIAHQMDPQS